ncbi:MAG: MBL fold metallo-hydrolase [Kutzneria sp.]|nr:MBL fold metallo-hydrolase [Kutzneria sp.]
MSTEDLTLSRLVVGALETNCWILRETGSNHALVIDPGDEPDRVLDAVGDLTVVAVAVTHAHFDHVLGLAEVAGRLGAPIIGHPAEEAVWRNELTDLRTRGYFDAGTATETLLAEGRPPRPDPALPLWQGHFDQHVSDGDTIALGELRVRVLHAPGHTPGGICLAVRGQLFTGDTLFPGGPGLTGWPLSDFDTIMISVRRLLGEFPADTVVHPGHGSDTTVGRESPHVEEWQSRGW